jgi:hypothetical protein
LVQFFVMHQLAHFQLEDQPQNEREILGILLVADIILVSSLPVVPARYVKLLLRTVGHYGTVGQGAVS